MFLADDERTGYFIDPDQRGGYFVDPGTPEPSIPIPNFSYTSSTPLPQNGPSYIPDSYFSSSTKKPSPAKPRPEAARSRPIAQPRVEQRKYNAASVPERTSNLPKRSGVPTAALIGGGLVILAIGYFIFSE